MDINDLRAIGTILAFGAFIGVCIWAWSSKRASRFDDAAHLPFDADDEAMHTRSVAEKNHE